MSQPATLMPVIKSNAYGHGLKEIYSILSSQDPSIIGVNYIEEAEELRTFGYKKRILIVGPVPQEKYPDVEHLGAEFFLGDELSLTAWLALDQKPLAHLKIDTGMSRQGFHLEELEISLHKLKAFSSQVLGIASHFANVEDVVDLSYAKLQIERFQKAQELAKSLGFKLTSHIASSASTLLMEEVHEGLTRVGISLYGLWPSQATRLSYLKNHSELAELSPVLQWKSEVAITKAVQEGDYIGYGCTYRAVNRMTVAVIPVGYYEGYPRIASGRGSYVLINGKRCPIVGRICMNMMTVDISHVSNTSPGDEVTLIGTDGNETIEAEKLGSWAETIHYEVLTCLNERIPRRIIP